MTVHPPASIEPGAPSPPHGRRGIRRWLLIFGSVAVIVLIGAVTVYAATTGTDEPDAAGQMAPSPPASSATLAANTAPPTQVFPTEEPTLTETDLVCLYTHSIINNMMTSGSRNDYVETRRTAAGQLRDLAEDYPGQGEALEALADEIDAAAQMVEDDPSTELAAFEREEAASYAFFDAVTC